VGIGVEDNGVADIDIGGGRHQWMYRGGV